MRVHRATARVCVGSVSSTPWNRCSVCRTMDRTRCRASVNAPSVSRKLEGGTSPVPARLAALGRLAREGQDTRSGWSSRRSCPSKGGRLEYGALLDRSSPRRSMARGMSPWNSSRTVSRLGARKCCKNWYPNTTLDLVGGKPLAQVQQVWRGEICLPARNVMGALRAFFEREIAAKLPQARILYWT